MFSSKTLLCLRTCTLVLSRMKVLLKPDESMFRNLFERAGLFEEMRGARHNHQTLWTGKESVGCPVHFDDQFIVATDNQQRRRDDRRQVGFGQIRSAAPPHDSPHRSRSAGRRPPAAVAAGRVGGSRAPACGAAPAPVLAPKYPILRPFVRVSCSSQALADR